MKELSSVIHKNDNSQDVRNIDDIFIRITDIYTQDIYNIIYNTCPTTDISYKKHITNVLKMAEQNEKGGIMDIKWSKQQYEKHYAYKCWLVYIDARENRLIIILWDGSRLPPTLREPFI